MTSKTSNNIFLDYYQVLGVSSKTPLAEIKKKYLVLTQKYHPDKSKEDTSDLFQLIQRAWETLGNEEKRHQYDINFDVESKAVKSDHIGLKNSFVQHEELAKKTTKTKQEAMLEFQKAMDDMNTLRGIDKKLINDNKIKDKPDDIDDTNDLVENLILEREQDNIEYVPPKIEQLDGKGWNAKKFHQIFDDYKKQNNMSNTTSIIKAQNLDSFSSSFAGFSNIDPSDEFDGDDKCSSIKNFGPTMKDVKLDTKKYNSIKEAEYVSNHNKKDDNYVKELEKLINDRKLEDVKLNSIAPKEFINDPSKSYTFLHETKNIAGMLEDVEDDKDVLSKANKKLLALESKTDSKK